MLNLISGSGAKVVFVAVAGRSNGLGPVLSGNTSYPVINCPPVKANNVGECGAKWAGGAKWAVAF